MGITSIAGLSTDLQPLVQQGWDMNDIKSRAYSRYV
jgi:hypothetical protein